MAEIMTAPLEGYLILPEPSENDKAAAIICGSDEIRALGLDEDRIVAFHGFVQLVLETTVGDEIRRLAREIEILKALR